MAIETPPTLEVRKLTFDDVVEMAAAEIIKDTERVELVDGVLVTMSPEGMRHADVTTWLSRRMTSTYAAPIEVRMNVTRPMEEPHNFRVPDILIVHPADGRWAQSHEVILAVEVAFTSLANDLGPKASHYARWGVAVYWVLDLVNNVLVAHADPSVDGYRSVRRMPSNCEVRLPESSQVFRVAELFERPTA